MKRTRWIFAGVICCFAIVLFASISSVGAFASEANDQNYGLSEYENIARGIFGDVQIESCEEIYGLNDSPDFVYVNFKDNGYAVFFKDTMEMLEYFS